jgi:hypothetical protein
MFYNIGPSYFGQGLLEVSDRFIVSNGVCSNAIFPITLAIDNRKNSACLNSSGVLSNLSTYLTNNELFINASLPVNRSWES